MRSRMVVFLVASVAAVQALHAQTVNHPWHVNDRGGGASTSGGILLRSSIGQLAIQRSDPGGVGLEAGYIPGLRFFSGSGTLDVQTDPLWNLLSVPLAVDDFSKASLYPAAVSAAYVYAGGYHQADTLRVGTGFWLKFDTSVTVPFSGSIVATETVDVIDKWNIVGSLSHPLPVANIAPVPPASIVSDFFGYSGTTGYFPADTLQPGYGYWVKVDSAGKLTLAASPAIPGIASAAGPPAGRAATTADEPGHAITVRDALGRERTIWFASAHGETDPKKWQLPPLPPSGIMDVRFATDVRLETAEPGNAKEVGIRISSASYPVTISWKTGGRDAGAVLLADDRVIELGGDGMAGIAEPPMSLKLRLAPSSGDRVPAEFALLQNYPNPFNPSTVIRYDLPADVRVSLRVFNLLGEETAALVDEVQRAGYKSVTWNAAGVPSGVYFCRLVAGEFEQTRKLVIVK